MPRRSRDGSGSIPRWILKELERLKVVEKDKNGYAILFPNNFLTSDLLDLSAAGSSPPLVSAILTALLALSPARTPLLPLPSKQR